MIRVYLAGGLKTDWQQRVIDAFAGDSRVEFFDPRTVSPQGGGDIQTAAKLERGFLRQANILFVYAEKDNTSPIGLAAEMGFFTGLPSTGTRRPIIVADELHTRGMLWLAHFTDTYDFYREDAFDRALDRLRWWVDSLSLHLGGG